MGEKRLLENIHILVFTFEVFINTNTIIRFLKHEALCLSNYLKKLSQSKRNEEKIFLEINLK